jgi:hypothetical protein
MLEIAITSLKCALRDEFPEFREFFENRGWEEKADEPSEAESAEAETTATASVCDAPVAAAKSNPDHAEEIFEEIKPVTAFEAKPNEEEV